jgi:hypothetical protein
MSVPMAGKSRAIPALEVPIPASQNAFILLKNLQNWQFRYASFEWLECPTACYTGQEFPGNAYRGTAGRVPASLLLDGEGVEAQISRWRSRLFYRKQRGPAGCERCLRGDPAASHRWRRLSVSDQEFGRGFRTRSERKSACRWLGQNPARSNSKGLALKPSAMDRSRQILPHSRVIEELGNLHSHSPNAFYAGPQPLGMRDIAHELAVGNIAR